MLEKNTFDQEEAKQQVTSISDLSNNVSFDISESSKKVNKNTILIWLIVGGFVFLLLAIIIYLFNRENNIKLSDDLVTNVVSLSPTPVSINSIQFDETINQTGIESIYNLYNNVTYFDDPSTDEFKLYTAYWTIPEENKELIACPKEIEPSLNAAVGSCARDSLQGEFGAVTTSIDRSILEKYITELFGSNTLKNKLPLNIKIGCNHYASYNDDLDAYLSYVFEGGCGGDGVNTYKLLLGSKKIDDETLELYEGYLKLSSEIDGNEVCNYYDENGKVIFSQNAETDTFSCPDPTNYLNNNKQLLLKRTLILRKNAGEKYYLTGTVEQ